MRLTKSLLSVIAALALATGTAFANGEWLSYESGGPSMNESMPLSSLETTDEAYFAQSEFGQSETTMTDSMTLASTGSSMESSDVFYIYPVEIVEVQEIWLVPSIDTESPQG